MQRIGWKWWVSVMLTALLIGTAGCGSAVDPKNGGDGSGATPMAVVSPTSISFGDQTVDTTSAPQTVTVSNTGSTAFTTMAVSTASPFAISGFSGATRLNPGESLTFSVMFSPTSEGSVNGTLTISFDVLANKTVSLSGRGTALPASSLTITTSSLPGGTLNVPYSTTLTASGGVGPISWFIVSGFAAPELVLNLSTGVLSGIPVMGGDFNFFVQVTDSDSPPASDTQYLILDIFTTQTGNCDNFSTGAIPLNDLGSGLYQNMPGGLYPGSSNVRPAAHEQAGLNLAKSIEPLDTNGNPDPNGKYVLLSIGMSNTTSEFSRLKFVAEADPDKEPSLVIVDGAQGGWGASDIIDPTASYWSTIENRLSLAGVTPNQVVVAWVKESDGFLNPFPDGATFLQAELEEIARILKSKYPNIKLAYYSSRIYGAYTTTISPEPGAYESGFAVKWLIESQINGNPLLNFDPAQGLVVAPWLSWGPYMWADGVNPRSDGLFWACDDFIFDGVHPDSSGRAKVANMLLNSLKTDSTAREWYLANP